MAREPEDDGLLRAVLSETVSARFREQLLQKTLQRARHRQRRRRALPAAGVALSLVLLAIALTWRFESHRQRGGAETTGLIVSTQPFDPGRIVRTQPFDATTQTGGRAPYELVRSDYRSGLYRIVGDQELLALAAPRQAILVRIGPHAQELVFATDPHRATDHDGANPDV